MTELNNKEIYKLDEILIFLNSNKGYGYENYFLAEKFEVSLHQFNFLYDKIVEFSLNEFSIGNVVDRGKSYAKIECNYLTDRFIQSGGFKKYYSLKKEKELQQNQSQINNIFNGSIINSKIEIDNSSNKNNDESITKNFEKNGENKFLGFLSKFWWQILIPFALLVVGLLIENYYFK
ncbi:hypothetical protein ACFO3U_09575 [Flavobacterium ponti]|uniref:Uncharacterized protein n=1 Tax=Flavobacterium ponti TaxID=665133 RepID=A0ABV9P699_9FLAO